MNGCTAETEGCERWAPNLYLHPNQRRQAREDGKKTDGYVWREKIISKGPNQEAGMGGWKQENKQICFKENCILGLGFKLIDCYIWKR